MVKLLEPLRMGYMIHLGAKMRYDAIVAGSIVDLLLARRAVVITIFEVLSGNARYHCRSASAPKE
jgi:hypothetical protein